MKTPPATQPAEIFQLSDGNLLSAGDGSDFSETTKRNLMFIRWTPERAYATALVKALEGVAELHADSTQFEIYEACDEARAALALIKGA